MDCTNKLLCPQLLIGFGSGSSGGRWKGERSMRPRHSFPWLPLCVLMVCWFSTEGVSAYQLHTTLSPDSSFWAKTGSGTLL